MISEKEILEIKEHLENTKNPIFLFDNDADGLCSFLILQRALARGRGVVVKSLPGLNKDYFRKVEEFKADSIFVLDKPIIDQDFIDLADKAGIPIIVLDHHNVPKPNIKHYYNTFYSSGKNEPVSYLCYKITERKEDIWLSVLGSISDSFIPEFFEDFKNENKELVDYKYKNAFDILYNTELGKIMTILNFALKDKTSNVVAMIKFLMKVQNPREILEENSKTNSFLKRYKEINDKYQRIVKKAEGLSRDKIIFFRYSGDLSINQHVANELFYKHPDKVVVVIYSKGDIANISLRWKKDIRTATVNALNDIEGASGGGHEHSTGARMNVENIPRFKENLITEIEKINKGE